ncbi:MAG: M3 family oligoendopeptidase, partial [Gemmatimonadales bacterium]
AMTFSLPDSPSAFAGVTWDDIQVYYRELAARPLDGKDVEGWLRDWSRLEELLSEAAGEAMIGYTLNTEDPAREAAHLRFSTEIIPRADEAAVVLARRLVASGFQQPDLGPVLERFRTQIETFREANVPLLAELEQLGTRYQKITGGMSVEWDGRPIPLPQLQPWLRSGDRAVRERAFRSSVAPYAAARDELAGLFTRMFRLRVDIARNAGFEDYLAYSFRTKYRFAYTAADTARFHEAIESVVTPAVERVYRRRAERLGLDRLRPWDTVVDPYSQEPLVPFDDVADLADRAHRVVGRVDPELGREFGIMRTEGLLDLGSRRGKAPGGYCETLHARGRPFIFMNAAGTLDDVMTLFHESGHAFHAFATHPLPFVWQRVTGMEAAELASMTMELLALPHLGESEGGFFDPVDTARARIHHLEDILVSLAHIASVDAFQTWIYTSGAGHEAAARDEAWLGLRERFERGVDWTGLEQERVCRWYRQLHIFLYPFYYIEYGLAQLGALEIWRNSLEDPAGALAAYRRALALGSTRPLPAIYAAAGTRLIFDAGAVASLVALVESQVGAAEAELEGLCGAPGGC